MENNAMTIEFGHFLKATAYGDLAVIAVAVVVLAWLTLIGYRARSAVRARIPLHPEQGMLRRSEAAKKADYESRN